MGSIGDTGGGSDANQQTCLEPSNVGAWVGYVFIHAAGVIKSDSININLLSIEVVDDEMLSALPHHAEKNDAHHNLLHFND